MAGPGEYLPDATEGVIRVEDLPKPKVVRRSRDHRKLRCPECGHKAYRNRRQSRTLRDVGDPVSERPRDIMLTVSQHHCTRCDRYFLADTSDIAPPGSRYTCRVIAMAVRLVVEDGLPYRLFDRRCRTETALVKLARLRRKAWRFKSVRHTLKKLWSPNLLV
jgi:transposase